jgi:transcriptional regulator with XRE-family HTH domain
MPHKQQYHHVGNFAKNKKGIGKLHKTFGARIRYFRLGIGLSQEELAGRCGLDRAYVGGIERGERNPSLKNISIIASALGVPIAALFDTPEAPPARARTNK